MAIHHLELMNTKHEHHGIILTVAYMLTKVKIQYITAFTLVNGYRGTESVGRLSQTAL